MSPSQPAGSPRMVIIGGVAAGASCAARARRLSEQASITIVERGPDVSFANCGLPYYIGGEILTRGALQVQTPQSLRDLLAIDVRVDTEAVEIDRAGRRVHLRSVASGEDQWLGYDKLLIATGAAPVRPPIPGIDDPRVHTLRSLRDMDAINAAAAGARHAVVVGAGFIGLEMAEQLRRRDIAVHLVELMPQVLPQMDCKLTLLLADELRRNKVDLRLKDAVTAFESTTDALCVHLRSGNQIPADVVVLSVGVRPENGLAGQCGLELGRRGHIVVNEFLQTSDPDIYAAGDAVETEDRVVGGSTAVPLGGPANRQGRLVANHILAPRLACPWPGSQGTAIVRCFDVAAGLTGWTEKRLADAGCDYRTITVNDNQHAGYFPGAQPLTLKIAWDPADGRLLGAQCVGAEGVDKRIDVLATAIAARMTIHDLADLELAYAPPFGSAKDIVNIAGMAAVNAGDGLLDPTDTLPADGSAQVLDVRPVPLATSHPVPGAINIPLPLLRKRLGELDRSRPVVTVCAFGKTSYFAARILAQNGFKVRSLTGGIKANIDPRTPSKPLPPKPNGKPLTT